MNRLPIIFLAAQTVLTALVHFAALTVLAALTTACNPDMFIEPMTVSESKFVMPFTGGTIEVQVSHGDWEIERVALDHIDCWFETDAEGNMRHESNFTTFEIARPQSDKLVLTVEDMSNSNPMEMEIYISNPFQSQVVYVHMDPCTGYEFDRIEYGEPVITSPADAYEEAWSLAEVNEASETVTQEYDVFGSMLERVIWFPAATVVSKDLPYVQWYETLMQFVKGPFEVPVPGAVPTGALSDNVPTGAPSDNIPTGGQSDNIPTDIVPFGYDALVIPMDAPDTKAAVTLMPGENTVCMCWGYIEYTMPYTMWFRHDGGGRPRYMTGEFRSRAYDGRWRVEVR